MFFFKDDVKMKQEDYFQTSLFFKKALYKVKTSGKHLTFDIFW